MFPSLDQILLMKDLNPSLLGDEPRPAVCWDNMVVL
jgi:hypothetical protein